MGYDAMHATRNVDLRPAHDMGYRYVAVLVQDYFESMSVNEDR